MSVEIIDCKENNSQSLLESDRETQKMIDVCKDQVLSIRDKNCGWALHPVPNKENHPDVSALIENFCSDGFICLSNVFCADNPNFCARRAAQKHFQSTFQTLYQNKAIPFPDPHHNGKYLLKCGVKHGYREIVMRSPGRYELSLLPHTALGPSFDNFCLDAQIKALTKECNDSLLLEMCLNVLQNHSFINLVRGCLSSTKNSFEKDIYLCNISLVIATPGAVDQHWHADGGHIDLSKHGTPHCINIFFPLCDLFLENGPTELRPGTHYHTRKLAAMMLAAKARKTLRKAVTPMLKYGDALVFDHRILHRGRANMYNEDRPILVMTFAKRWFRDLLNFPRNSMYDEIKQLG